MSAKYAIIRAAFELLALSQAPAVIRKFSRSRGVIFTLHRVLPDKPPAFSPNAILQVTPDFLDYTIKRVRELGFDVVTMDEAIERIEAPEKVRPFVVFTFDDAYRDNLQFGLDVMRANAAPFTLFVATAFIDGVGEVWWQAIEDIIASREAIAIPGAGGNDYLPTATLAEKQATYDTLYAKMRKMPEAERVALMRGLGEAYGLDLDEHCRRLIMNWDELQTFVAEPLCTIGAHTVHHYELAKLSAAELRSEMEGAVRILAERLGVTPTHFSYPIGGKASAGAREYAMARELGFRSAVTTLPGGLFQADKDHLWSLPRVSLNGLFQSRRYVDVFATGGLFSMLGRADE